MGAPGMPQESWFGGEQSFGFNRFEESLLLHTSHGRSWPCTFWLARKTNIDRLWFIIGPKSQLACGFEEECSKEISSIHFDQNSL